LSKTTKDGKIVESSIYERKEKEERVYEGDMSYHTLSRVFVVEEKDLVSAPIACFVERFVYHACLYTFHNGIS